MPADILSALEIECKKLPTSAEEVPNNDYDPRHNRVRSLDTNGPDLRQLQAITQDITEDDLRQHQLTNIEGHDI